MINLIRKRHPSPAWFVFDELSNSTGAQVSRRADAVAFGIWPSHKFRIIGYEFKISRADVQRELADPSKADAIGKYCDEWYLVVSDPKIIADLVIPDPWGILTPKAQTLRAIRKASPLTPAPVSRGFVASMIRNAMANYVPKPQANALAEELNVAKRELRAAQGLPQSANTLEHAHEQLKADVAAFEERSGVRITGYNGRAYGETFRLLHESRHVLGEQALARQIASLDHVAANLSRIANEAKNGAAALREALRPEQLDLLHNVPSDGSTCG